jgi:DNA-directed RNA polymerase subunit omega
MDLKKLSDAEKKVGGKFKLSTLMQKRLIELMRGAPKLVDLGAASLHEIVVDEILQGKIWLGEAGEEGEGPEGASPDSSI